MSSPLPLSGFTYDDEHDVWVSEGFPGLGWADGGEPYLESLFSSGVEITDYPVELSSHIKDWPSRYHLSHVRTNLLESIREIIDPSWRALELGGGPGAISKWLAGAVAWVDVLEGSPARAQVNRLRTRADENVRVLVGDMTSAALPHGYDLITLIGVLEYTVPAPGQTRAEACAALLGRIRGLLAPDGILLVAIENRLGVKYWSGCSEDHTQRVFDGLVGYPDDGPITFSRKELGSLLADAGYPRQQFYHLMPDYKLPTTVIRECEELAGVSAHNWAIGFGEDYMVRRQHLAPDPLLFKSMEDAGLLPHFSNSFLVLSAPSGCRELSTDWLIRKMSNSARPELHHTVTLRQEASGIVVRRRPIRQGVSEIDLGPLAFALDDAEYVPGSLLAFDAYAALLARDWYARLLEVYAGLRDYASASFATGRQDDSGVELLAGQAFDCVPWNVIKTTGGGLRFVDRKWTAVEPPPIDYILYRGVFWLLVGAAPFLREDVASLCGRILEDLGYPADGSRLMQHRARETQAQLLVHADDPSRVSLDQDGLLVLPPSGGALGLRFADGASSGP